MSLKTLILQKLLSSFLGSDTPAGKLVAAVKAAYASATTDDDGVVKDVEQFLASLVEQDIGDDVVALIEEVGETFSFDTTKITAFLTKVESVASELVTLVGGVSTGDESDDSTDSTDTTDTADA